LVQVADRRASLWRNSDFTAFWLGETVSLVGTQVSFVALPLVAITTLDVGSTGVGVLRFAEYVPFLAFTLLFGVWADRHRRRPLMMASNIGRGLLIGLVPLCAAVGLLRLPLLVLLAFFIGTCAALFEVCWLSFVPSLVDRDDLVAALGRTSASHSAAEVAGPGIGGLLVQLLTAPLALAADAASYVVSTVSLMLIRRPESDVGPVNRPHRVLGELSDGLRSAFGDPYIRATAFAAALGNFFALITETVFLVYAVHHLRMSPSLIGLTLSASGVGGLLGASFASTLTRRVPVGRLYIVARVVGSLGTLLLPLASGPTVAVVGMCMASYVIWQAPLAVTNVINGSLRLLLTPDHLRGRMNASVRTLAYGALPLGGLAGGVLGAVVGLHLALWLGAIGYFLSIVPILWSPLPRLRALPNSDGAGHKIPTR
jgi:MFS family permease